MKAISHFLVAGVIVLGTACSSTNTDISTGGSATGSSTAGTRMSTDMNPPPASDSNSGMAANGGIASSGTGDAAGTNETAASDESATGAAAAAAFMGTFATMLDPVFLVNAASSNLLELQAGQMAAQKASNAEVKSYAQMMISHHTKATQDLTVVAKPLGLTPPQTLMPVHQAMLNRLNNKTGKAFDEAYMDLMETAHKMDIAMFGVKSKAAENPAVRTFATKTLPMLRSHQRMAGTIEKKID